MLRAFKYNICKYTIETIICFYFIVHCKIQKIIRLFVEMYMYFFLKTSIRYFDQIYYNLLTYFLLSSIFL